jgi:hypothetical protein
LFRDNDFRQALLALVGFVVNLVPVDKHDHIRILLNRAGFAQIGHHRPAVAAVFNTSIELR